MLRRIRCKNFRGFREFDTRIEPVTALLGPNSSGKTTALHAVRLACEGIRWGLEAETAVKIDDGWVQVTADSLIEPARLLPLADWRALFVDQTVGEGITFEIGLEFEATDAIQELSLEVVCARNEQLKFSVRARSQKAVELVKELSRKSKHINQRLADFLREHAPVAVFVPPFYGTVREEEYRSRASIDRMLGSGDQSHVVRNLVVGLDADQFERLNVFLDDVLGARLTSRTRQDEVQDVTHLEVHFRDSNGDIELSAAGAGLVNLVALYTALSRWRAESARRTVMFLLDEPEAHLHPRLQAESAERIGRLVTDDFRAQLLLATHSVDILNRLADTGALLVRCDRNTTPSTFPLADDRSLFDDLSRWVDLTPYTAINALASRRIVFCEGTDELELLPTLAALRFRNDPAGNRNFRRWALVQLQGAGNAKVAGVLNHLVNTQTVRPDPQAPTFRAILVLDRDYERIPGVRTRTIGKVEEAEVVWSLHSLESLLLEPAVLTVWLTAFLGTNTPHDIAARVQAATTTADVDSELNLQTASSLCAQLLRGTLNDTNGRELKGEAKAKEAFLLASRRVQAEPRSFQRGKDRSRVILGQVRDQLPSEMRNQMPTDVVALVKRANQNAIADWKAAIPTELADLLTRMVSAK